MNSLAQRTLCTRSGADPKSAAAAPRAGLMALFPERWATNSAEQSLNGRLKPQARLKKRPAGLVVLLLGLLAFFTGCGSTQSRALTEQLLISDAVDRAIQQIDFSDLADQRVYLDDQYLVPIQGPGFVNAHYVESCIRQHLVASGCLLQDVKENADIVVEARMGAMGADAHEVVYGIPQNNALSAAATVFANAPSVPTIPEISAGKTSIGFGAAKIAVFAYVQQTREPLWQSGVVVGKSHSRDVWMLGAGPIQSGTIYSSTRFAGQRLAWLNLNRRTPEPKLSPTPYLAEAHFNRYSDVRMAQTDSASETTGDSESGPQAQTASAIAVPEAPSSPPSQPRIVEGPLPPNGPPPIPPSNGFDPPSPPQFR